MTDMRIVMNQKFVGQNPPIDMWKGKMKVTDVSVMDTMHCDLSRQLCLQFLTLQAKSVPPEQLLMLLWTAESMKNHDIIGSLLREPAFALMQIANVPDLLFIALDLRFQWALPDSQFGL
jgi:hypothetical protein